LGETDRRNGTHLADEEVLRFEVTTEHLGRFSWYGVNLDADLLALPGGLHRLVIVFYAAHHAQLNELKRQNSRNINMLIRKLEPLMTHKWLV
jgi:hypothetical protein